VLPGRSGAGWQAAGEVVGGGRGVQGAWFQHGGGGDHVAGRGDRGGELGGAAGEDELVIAAQGPVQRGDHLGLGGGGQLVQPIEDRQDVPAPGQGLHDTGA
jgi:hypothetical protein